MQKNHSLAPQVYSGGEGARPWGGATEKKSPDQYDGCSGDALFYPLRNMTGKSGPRITPTFLQAGLLTLLVFPRPSHP